VGRGRAFAPRSLPADRARFSPPTIRELTQLEKHLPRTCATTPSAVKEWNDDIVFCAPGRAGRRGSQLWHSGGASRRPAAEASSTARSSSSASSSPTTPRSNCPGPAARPRKQADGEAGGRRTTRTCWTPVRPKDGLNGRFARNFRNRIIVGRWSPAPRAQPREEYRGQATPPTIPTARIPVQGPTMAQRQISRARRKGLAQHSPE